MIKLLVDFALFNLIFLNLFNKLFIINNGDKYLNKVHFFKKKSILSFIIYFFHYKFNIRIENCKDCYFKTNYLLIIFVFKFSLNFPKTNH